MEIISVKNETFENDVRIINFWAFLAVIMKNFILLVASNKIDLENRGIVFVMYNNEEWHHAKLNESWY